MYCMLKMLPTPDSVEIGKWLLVVPVRVLHHRVPMCCRGKELSQYRVTVTLVEACDLKDMDERGGGVRS